MSNQRHPSLWMGCPSAMLRIPRDVRQNYKLANELPTDHPGNVGRQPIKPTSLYPQDDSRILGLSSVASQPKSDHDAERYIWNRPQRPMEVYSSFQSKESDFKVGR